MINWIKRCGIGLVDFVHALADPFDDFTRDPIPSTPSQTLRHREEKFRAQLNAEFVCPNGLVLYNRPMVHEPLDYGDLAIWHGVATAMFAWRFTACNTVAAQGDLDRTAGALMYFWPAHETTGEKILARGMHPTTGDYRYDVSNDGCTGHLFGAYHAALSNSLGARMAGLTCLQNLAGELLLHNDNLVNLDGRPTTHGKLINGLLTDPTRATLCLAVHLAAAVLLDDGNVIKARAAEHFREIWKKYGRLIDLAEFKFLWMTKTHEAHRAAMNLYVMADLLERFGDADGRDKALRGLARIVQLERKTANWWILALAAARHPEGLDVQHAVDLAVSRMREIDPDARPLRIERRNSQDAHQWKQRGIRFFEWGGKLVASQPLPPWTMGNQDFMPQRDLMSVDDNLGETNRHSRYSGLDFLAPYWLLRRHGLIGEFL